jgi:hypothetical protein
MTPAKRFPVVRQDQERADIASSRESHSEKRKLNNESLDPFEIQFRLLRLAGKKSDLTFRGAATLVFTRFAFQK